MGTSYVRALIEAEQETWLTTLQEKYKIHVAQDGDLVSLKYNQIESPMAESIVQECRGMVVCTRRKQILAWPYVKFWNVGEHLAAQIDWTTARVQDKADGSLMLLMWDPEHDQREGWRVASSGHPTASGSFGSDSRTFAQAFWDTWDELGMESPSVGMRNTTFMFEFCAQPNRIVVRHDKPRIILHGARERTDGQESDGVWIAGVCDLFKWEAIREFPLTSLDECLEAAAQLDPLQQEGFVVVDAAFNRVKIKSPRYVALHHLKGDALTTRRAIELWCTGECTELLANFPELEPDIRPVHDKLDNLARRAVEDFAANRNAPTRKDFALAVKHLPHSSILFRMLTDDIAANQEPAIVTAAGIMRGLSTQALERLLEAS